MKCLILIFFVLSKIALAEHSAHMDHSPHNKNRGKVFLLPSDCGEMEIWDPITAMCMPFPNGMQMTHLMLHGNVFASGITQSSSRGEDAITSTQMLMGNLGITLAERHFVNLSLMTTLEKWTLPQKGYPLLLQTGESNHDEVPYVDAQHPHSSPIMGLMLSDTIRLDASTKNHLKLFFAPRGQSTDGPIAFMHRATGVVHPDAPLGHHIGQDVGHISSTVIGALVRLGNTSLELSIFNGTEPEPDAVNLPLGTPNSGAVRLTQYFSDSLIGMVSFAFVNHPHGDHTATAASASTSFDQDVTQAVRYSASLYTKHRVLNEWDLYNTLIYGSIKTWGVDTSRHSFSHELSLTNAQSTVFTRLEILQKLPSELLISAVPAPNEAKWFSALTLGYSYLLKDFESVKLNLGASATHYFLPQEFQNAYAGNPWRGLVFLQLSGMEMWAL